MTRRAFVVLACGVIAACGGDDALSGDDAGDGDATVLTDGADDATPTTDATVDATNDGPLHDGPLSDPDARSDATVDANAEASADASVDANATDAGVDASVDAAMDARVDAAVDAGVDAAADAGPDASATGSVIQHHDDRTRSGVYVDARLTRTAAAGLHRDTTFNATYSGPVYAQPLFVDNGGAGDLLVVATEQAAVLAFSASTGAQVWARSLGTPVALANLPCGNIDPLGVTGTPIIDLAARTLYVDAMTTPDNGATKRHLVFALSIDDGSVRAGWPVDVGARASFGGVAFDSSVQNQRGALALVNGTLYVPYGGHFGDCGTYYGWVVGISTPAPTNVQAWRTTARGGGVWGPGGVASDGTSIFVATGNTFGAATWSGGEAIIRLAAGPTFSGATADWFAPTNWVALDNGDVDIGGSGVLVVDVPGATPSALAVALGKDGTAYAADRANLGGAHAAPAQLRVSSSEIINAPAWYRTATSTYVAFSGNGVGCPSGPGDLTAMRLGATSPPSIAVAWCASVNGQGSPMVTTTDGRAGFIVWSVGAESSERLYGFDADTGAVVFGGGGAAEHMGLVRRFQTPIVAKGRVFVASDTALVAFTP